MTKKSFDKVWLLLKCLYLYTITIKRNTMTFKEIQINQEFKTSNGRPSVKISKDEAKSLVPVCVSGSANYYIEEMHFKVKPNDWVYLS